MIRYASVFGLLKFFFVDEEFEISFFIYVVITFYIFVKIFIYNGNSLSKLSFSSEQNQPPAVAGNQIKLTIRAVSKIKRSEEPHR